VFALMKVVVLNHMSLDGVIQSPGRPDEDARDGFAHGGWAAAGGDEVMAKWVGPGGSGGAGAMLMGRRSYEGHAGLLERQGRPVQGRVEYGPEIVASSNPSTRLDWPNPLLLGGGVRLFPDDGKAHQLELVDSTPTMKGVILAG
jgi:dihydrofolate reductase